MSSGPADPPPEWSNAAIVELLTAERLRSYFAATNGEITEVMRLYEWNTDAAAAVISLISMTEVIVRNALDSALTNWSRRRHPSVSWLDAVPLDARGRADIAQARERATRRRPHGVHGKVIAELPFGFWRFLTASRYLTTLWIRHSPPHSHTDTTILVNGANLSNNACSACRSFATEPLTTNRFTSATSRGTSTMRQPSWAGFHPTPPDGCAPTSTSPPSICANRR